MGDPMWDVPRARALLHEAGFQFCDVGPVNRPDQAWFANQDAALASFLKMEPLIDVGEATSSRDHPNQGIECTLNSDETFWSSTGSRLKDSDEWLMYRLLYPLNVVSAVTIHVYRARFQIGHPMYPPQEVSFEVGPSPRSLQPVPGRWKFAIQDMPQTFLLPASANVGRYVKINLHGKRQRQFEDDLWYTAIRTVSIGGHAVAPSDVLTAKNLVTGVPMNSPLCLTGANAAFGGPYFPAHLLIRNCDPMDFALPARGEPFPSTSQKPSAEETPEAQAAKKGALAAAFGALTKAFGLGPPPRRSEVYERTLVPPMRVDPTECLPRHFGTLLRSSPDPSSDRQALFRFPLSPRSHSQARAASRALLEGRTQQEAGMGVTPEANPAAAPQEHRDSRWEAGVGVERRHGTGEWQGEGGSDMEGEDGAAGEEGDMAKESGGGFGMSRSRDTETRLGGRTILQSSPYFEWGEAGDWDDG